MNKKITFFHPPQQDTFLRPIVQKLKGEKKYDVDTFSTGDEQQFFRTYHSSDLVWFEWANEQVVAISQHNPTKKVKQVVRLHSYEAFDGVQFKINWDKFDKLILVNESVKQIIQKGIPGLMQGVPIPDEKIEVIYNGVDVDKFAIVEDKKFNKKVAFIGLMNFKKAPELLIHCFESIHRYDPEFQFHIAGMHQDPRFALYLQNLEQHLDFPIIFDGYVSDINKYLSDKDFVISTSLFESFHYSIMEGMACGVVPLVHNWFGSDNVYPRENIFNTIPECVKIIDKFACLSTEEKKKQYELNRQYVVDNFSLDIQMREINNLIEELTQ